ncbi:MAG: 50S ribosome-binding GTPase [Phycisphaeraceae bacterium]|nr:50S ribosome-binding GTPase [Phycisphaeraceae bacterium]
MTSPAPFAQFAQRSTPGVASAVAVFELVGDVDRACLALGLTAPAVGRAALCIMPGVDTLLVIRPADDLLLVTPHGGVGVCRALGRALRDAGLPRREGAPYWPEAAGEVEARMLSTLASVRGHRAVRLLLDQPARWASGLPPVPQAVAAELARLLRPPLVVATGPANVGKSSLANALASRPVARVADRPGVTRDAVAVDLELDGLVVRWLDAPGVDRAEDAVLAQAQALAAIAIEAADLVLWCQDAWDVSQRPPDPSSRWLRLAMRADRGFGPSPGVMPAWADAMVSAHTGLGLAELASQIRRRLVGDAALSHPGAWAFWEPTPPSDPP